MDFIALFQAAQNGDGVLDGRLFHKYGLETALQGRVFFNVLAVFIDGGRPDHVQFAARQHGFEHITGIHRAFSCSCTDHGMHLVHEEHNFPGCRTDLLQHGF